MLRKPTPLLVIRSISYNGLPSCGDKDFRRSCASRIVLEGERQQDGIDFHSRHSQQFLRELFYECHVAASNQEKNFRNFGKQQGERSSQGISSLRRFH